MFNSTYSNHENFTTFSTLSLILASAMVLMAWSINIQNPIMTAPTVPDFQMKTDDPVILPGAERVRDLVGPDQETILIKPAMAGLPA